MIMTLHSPTETEGLQPVVRHDLPPDLSALRHFIVRQSKSCAVAMQAKLIVSQADYPGHNRRRTHAL